jgi:hypothetical protein
MSGDPLDELIARLDDVLVTTPKTVGVGMGIDLYREANKRGLISLETFSVLATGFWPHELPAYRKHHFVYLHPGLSDWDFRIGPN